MTALYGIFSTFLIFFYTSNMRSNLISPQYEKPMKTFDDITARGQTAYIPYDILRTREVEKTVSDFFRKSL